MSYDRRKEDIKRLDALLSTHRESLSEWELEAFGNMREGLQKYKELTSKQRSVVATCYEKLVPTYVNAVSSGVVPRGKEVELLVKDRPLRPPGRTK